MERRTLGILVSVVGVVFLITVFGNGLFGASSAWEDLSDDVRPVYTDEEIAALREDATRLRAVAQEFTGSVVPTLSAALGVSQAELAATFAGDFPATTVGVAALPTIAEGLEQRAGLLEAQQPNFRSADAIPTDDTSSVLVPWFITITGVLAIVFGLAMIGGGRPMAAGAIVLGAVMLLVPLITSLPSKAADADALNEATAPLFTDTSIEASQQAVASIEAMSSELNSRLLPSLASQLGLPPAQAQAFIAQNFPAIASSLQQLPETIARARTANAVIATNTDEFADVREVPNQTVAWTVVAGGIVTMLLGGFGLTADGRARAAAVRRRLRREREAA